jgi:hypothetical protein
LRQDAGAVPSPGSERRRVGFFEDVLRRTGAFAFAFEGRLVSRVTGRFARAGRVAVVRVVLVPPPRASGGWLERWGEAAAARIGVSQ